MATFVINSKQSSVSRKVACARWQGCKSRNEVLVGKICSRTAQGSWRPPPPPRTEIRLPGPRSDLGQKSGTFLGKVGIPCGRTDRGQAAPAAPPPRAGNSQPVGRACAPPHSNASIPNALYHLSAATRIRREGGGVDKYTVRVGIRVSGGMWIRLKATPGYQHLI